MDDYAGRVLADRYRLPLFSDEEYEAIETRAFDTYSGREVLVRQVLLPEVVDAEVLDADDPAPMASRAADRSVRAPADPAVRRAVEAAQAAAQVPDHPRLAQVFDVFAEEGSLWIVSELVAARPLAALLMERPLSPFRAAEIGSDVLTVLRVLHAHGWTHRNITVHTVLICDDGRVVLTGLAAGAAEEALCGYVPTPRPAGEKDGREGDYGDEDGFSRPAIGTGPAGMYAPPPPAIPPMPSVPAPLAEAPAPRGPAATEASRATGALHNDDEADPRGGNPYGDDPYDEGPFGVGDHFDGRRGGPTDAAHLRTARAEGIAAYREGARATARVTEDRRRTGAAGAEDTGSLPVQRFAGPKNTGPAAPRSHATDDPYGDDPYGDDPYTQAPYAHDPYAEVSHDEWDDDGDEDGRPPARRLYLTGFWSDGPTSGRPVPAGGSEVRRRDGSPALPAPRPGGQRQPGRQDEAAVSGPTGSAYRGPATPLAAERARQTRIAVVGAITERWAPEQAGTVHRTGRPAPPIGPPTDLWALGALLFRAVQGHAPYPEENAAELVRMVCGEPPAFAEKCGPLRPVVESLLRQDPTERPNVQELSGRLRSLVRSAPEPEAGLDVVPLPSADSARLPVVRRRGELVRRRRGRNAAHERHRHAEDRADRQDGPGPERTPGVAPPPRPPRPPREPKGPKALRTPPRPRDGERRAPRRLGRLLLTLILLALVAAIAYAVMFMPKADTEPGQGSTGPASSTPGSPEPGTDGSGDSESSQSPGAQQPQTSRSAVALAAGYALRKDPEGFEVGVPKGWQRSPANADRQIRYGRDGFSLLIVPGRDTVQAGGHDPLAYQADKELELQQFRDSTWSGSSGLRRIDVGRQAMAEGQFTWQDAAGREVYARNLVMAVAGRYHIVQVIGPENRRDKVTEIYEQAISAYRVTS